MKYFCSKCGKTTQYSFELPKFCAFCGQAFGNKPASTETEDKGTKFLNELKSKKIKSSYKPDIEEVDEIENEDIHNLDFKKVKAKYTLNIFQPKQESFGDLIDNPSRPSEENHIISHSSIKTKEEILLEFQNEAGSVRNKE